MKPSDYIRSANTVFNTVIVMSAFSEEYVVTATLILIVTISYLMMTKRMGIYQREPSHFTEWLRSQRAIGNEKPRWTSALLIVCTKMTIFEPDDVVILFYLQPTTWCSSYYCTTVPLYVYILS